MADRNKIYILADTVAECIMPDGTSRNLPIHRPNDPDKPYEVIWRKLRVQDGYRDPEYKPREGYNKFEFEFILGYDHHRIESLHLLLLADRINLKVPTYFYKDDRYYTEFNVQCLNDEFSEKPLGGFKVGNADSSLKRANPMPNASEQLRFRTDPYEWDDFETAMTWFNPVTLVGDDGEAIVGFVAGDLTADEEGVIISPLLPAEYGIESTENYTVGGKNFNIDTLKLHSNNE